jgi:hypothetical protein
MVSSDLEKSRRTVSTVKRMPVVHVAYDQYSSESSQSAGSILDIRQPFDKPQGLSIDDTLEISVGR